MPVRRSGQAGIGPYWPKIRRKVLTEVLKAQKLMQQEDESVQLITYQELVAIQLQWHRDFIFDFSVAEIYQEVFGGEINIRSGGEKEELETTLLKRVFGDDEEEALLVQQMLQVHQERSMMVKKVNLRSDLEALIDEYCLPKISHHYASNE